MTDREKELQELLQKSNAEIIRLHNQLVDVRLDKHDEVIADHETRVRSVELVATRNVMFALTTGGGLISIIVLLKTLMDIN